MPRGIYKRTEENNQKMSEAVKKNLPSTVFKKGCVPWCKGKTGKESHMYGNKKGFKKGQPAPKTAFKKGHTSWLKGKKGYTNAGSFKKGHTSLLTKEHIKKILRRRKMSSLEIRVNNVVKKNNLPYRFVGNGKFFIERKNPDFVNTNGEKIAVEVYCRRHKENLRGLNVDNWKKDRSKLFAKYGWQIIFIEDWQTNKEESIFNLLKGEI